jgi:hypothetical protein
MHGQGRNSCPPVPFTCSFSPFVTGSNSLAQFHSVLRKFDVIPSLMTSAPLVIAAGLEPASIKELAIALELPPKRWAWIHADSQLQLERHVVSGRRSIAIFDPEVLLTLPFDPSKDDSPFLLPHLGFLEVDSGYGINRNQPLYLPKPCSPATLRKIFAEAERRADCAACIAEQAVLVAAYFPRLIARKEQPYASATPTSLLAQVSRIFQIRQGRVEATQNPRILHTCGA